MFMAFVMGLLYGSAWWRSGVYGSGGRWHMLAWGHMETLNCCRTSVSVEVLPALFSSQVAGSAVALFYVHIAAVLVLLQQYYRSTTL